MPATQENHELIEQAAERASFQTCKLLFAHMGYDIENPDDIASLRMHMAFLKRAERGAREVESAIRKTCVGALVTGVIAVLFLGLKTQIAAWFVK